MFVGLEVCCYFDCCGIGEGGACVCVRRVRMRVVKEGQSVQSPTIHSLRSTIRAQSLTSSLLSNVTHRSPVQSTSHLL